MRYIISSIPLPPILHFPKQKTPGVRAGSPSNKDSPVNLVLADHSSFDHLVAFASFDGDFPRFDFLGLRQAECEHASLVIGLDLIGLDPGGEGDAAGEATVAALTQVVARFF